MGKYFTLQCKRQLRFLPGALCVALILSLCLLLAFQLFSRQNANEEENQKFPFAICGETEHSFLQMGLSALSSFDASRFALEVVEMEEADAARALARGEISAYVVVPDGFMDAALRGKILPLQFYSTAGATGLVSLVKEELSGVITQLLISSQKGVYGMYDAMVDNGLRGKVNGQMDRLSITYVDYIFTRDRIYRLEELGIADQLGLEGYLLCGLSVLLLLLLCLPFAAIMIPGDASLGRMLCAKGKSAWAQALCDFGAYAAGLISILAVLLGLAGLIVPDIGNGFSLFFKILPAALFAASFSFMLYSLSRDMVGGVMLLFFVSILLCFVSGCLYPVYFFPVQAQQLAGYLPAGLARAQLASCITGSAPGWILPALLGYCAVFFATGLWARVRHIQEVA